MPTTRGATRSLQKSQLVQGTHIPRIGLEFFQFISASCTLWICHNGLETTLWGLQNFPSNPFFLGKITFLAKCPLCNQHPVCIETCNGLLNKKVPALPKAQRCAVGLMKKWKFSSGIHLDNSAL